MPPHTPPHVEKSIQKSSVALVEESSKCAIEKKVGLMEHIFHILSRPVIWASGISTGDLPGNGPNRLGRWVAVFLLFTFVVGAFVLFNFRSVLDNPANMALAIAGWFLSGLIFFSSTVGMFLGRSALTNTQCALENTTQLLGVHLEPYSNFGHHVSQMTKHLAGSSVTCPEQVTLVLSTLLYGIQAREERGADPTRRALTSVEYFLDLLRDWVGRWKRAAEYDSTLHPCLRICLWSLDKHKNTFGINAPAAKDDKYKDALRQYARELIDILEDIEALCFNNWLTVEFTTTMCDETRVFLTKGNGECRTAFCIVTLLRPTELNAANVRHVGFEARDTKTYARFQKFAEECMHLSEDNGELKPHVNPRDFVKQWFDLTDGDLSEPENESVPSEQEST